MAFPTILFNVASGSDTAASGSGPTTALSGTAASYSGSVFTLDGTPDLSGVATDGTHLIWVQTSTGRQFFTINAVDDGADTVTVDDAPAGTTTGLTWGLGGKRNSLDNADNRLLFSAADLKGGWIVELEDDQTLTSGLVCAAAGYAMIRGASEHVVINQTSSNTPIFTSLIAEYVFSSLKFTNSHVTKGSNSVAFYFQSGGVARVKIDNCIFGDATNQLYSANYRNSSGAQVWISDCEIAHCTNNGWNRHSGYSGALYMERCWVHDNSSVGVFLLYGDKCHITHCTITDNGGDGIGFYGNSSSQRNMPFITNCTIDGNASEGIQLSDDYYPQHAVIDNNIISNNGTYGIASTYTASEPALLLKSVRNNNIYNNTSGQFSGIDETLGFAFSGNISVDPGFTDAAGGDYSVGENMKAVGLPLTSRTIGANQSATKSYVDIGAAQRQESAGGATRLINGGLIS